jgi:hypothetical protein
MYVTDFLDKREVPDTCYSLVFLSAKTAFFLYFPSQFSATYALTN